MLIVFFELLLNGIFLGFNLFFLNIVLVGKLFDFVLDPLLFSVQLIFVGIVLSLESQKVFV